MPLTDVEREIAKAVAKTYYVMREATTHEQLLRVFGDPRPISMLRDRYRIIAVQGNNHQAYLPTLLAFEHCGDSTLRDHARAAVEKVVAEVKALFKQEYKSDKQYPAATLLANTQNFGSGISDTGEHEIALGLFLVKEMPGIIQVQLNERSTEITAFRISDYILTIDPTKIWDEHVRTSDPLGLPQPTVPTPVKPPIQDRLAQKKRQKLDVSTRRSTVQRWPPAGWTILESLGEGGQAWTFKAHRKGDPSKRLFVLKRLKNKDRLARFEREIGALMKLEHPGILKIIETSQKGESPYFVAEHCEGRDLGKADLSKKGLANQTSIVPRGV